MSNKFEMFSKKERDEIMKNYNKIVKGNKPCDKYTYKEVLEAGKGMYIYPDMSVQSQKKNVICEEINRAWKEKKEPIVREDSLTAWGNNAAENYGLEVRDILKMKKGDKMKVYLLDRNVGDGTHGIKAGKKLSITKDADFSRATYTHDEGLTGKMVFDDIGVVHDPFTWEINLKALGSEWFWGPMDGNSCKKITDKEIKKLPKNLKVGWRGPAIDVKDAKYLPKDFVHYGTWWDDYMPFRTHNFLKIKRKKGDKNKQKGGIKKSFDEWLFNEIKHISKDPKKYHWVNYREPEVYKKDNNIAIITIEEDYSADQYFITTGKYPGKLKVEDIIIKKPINKYMKERFKGYGRNKKLEENVECVYLGLDLK